MTDVFPIEMKIEPKTEADQGTLLSALNALVQEDPKFRYDIDPESGEIIVAGQGEMHLDLKIHFIKERFGIGVEVGAPQVVYLEVLIRPVEVSYFYKPRELHGGGVKVEIAARPLERGESNAFVNAAVGVADEDAAAVEESIESLLDNGAIIGFPLVDCEVTLKGLERIGEGATASTVMIAARQAMREACRENVGLIEPVMAVTVRTPVESVGMIIADLMTRRGQIRGSRLDGNVAVVDADVPLGNMFGYINTSRAMTNGQATHGMAYSHYQLVPRNISGPDDDTFSPAVGKQA